MHIWSYGGIEMNNIWIDKYRYGLQDVLIYGRKLEEWMFNDIFVEYTNSDSISE